MLLRLLNESFVMSGRQMPLFFNLLISPEDEGDQIHLSVVTVLRNQILLTLHGCHDHELDLATVVC